MGRSVGIDSAHCSRPNGLSAALGKCRSDASDRRFHLAVCEGCLKQEDDSEPYETTQLLDPAANDSCKTPQCLVSDCRREIPRHRQTPIKSISGNRQFPAQRRRHSAERWPTLAPIGAGPLDRLLAGRRVDPKILQALAVRRPCPLMKRIPSFSSTRSEGVLPAMVTAITRSNCCTSNAHRRSLAAASVAMPCPHEARRRT